MRSDALFHRDSVVGFSVGLSLTFTFLRSENLFAALYNLVFPIGL